MLVLMLTFVLLFLDLTSHAKPSQLSVDNCKPKVFKRVSDEKCYEYRQLVAKNATNFESNYRKCNRQYCVTNGAGTIINGEITKLGEFPHMAGKDAMQVKLDKSNHDKIDTAIGWKLENGDVEFKCGGSLISERFVLTAAHCCYDSSTQSKPSFVRLGEQNLVSDDDGAQPIEIKILSFIKHPSYNSFEQIHDIALIELDTTMNFTDFIRPACLHTKKEFFEHVIATGWGVTENGTTSDELMKVILTIQKSEKCEDQLGIDEWLESQICVGGSDKDTCNGDSGGPIQIGLRGARCVYVIVGLTSYGSSVCGMQAPAVYTRVFSYIDWIERIVWP